MSRVKLNPKYLEITIEKVRNNKELSNMRKDTIIKCLEMEMNRRKNKEENLLYLLGKEVYRIDVDNPDPIIPMIVTEVSYNCIIKDNPPVCIIKTLDKDHSKENFYNAETQIGLNSIKALEKDYNKKALYIEIQISLNLFLTKSEAKEVLKELEKLSSPITHFKEEK